jgi:hypothetical protein
MVLRLLVTLITLVVAAMVLLSVPSCFEQVPDPADEPETTEAEGPRLHLPRRPLGSTAGNRRRHRL